MPETAPLVRSTFQVFQPEATAGNTRFTQAARAPFTGAVSKVSVTPVTVITGAATNNRTHNLYNRGQTGGGSTLIATRNYASGTNAPADDETELTLQAAANLAVVEGDILEFESLAVGTGIADPGGLLRIEFTRS